MLLSCWCLAREERFNVEAVSSPSGVTHLTYTRR
jgi:hypothetical protein